MVNLEFAKIRKSNNLTTELADLLRKQIKEGQYTVGTKLPSSKFIEEKVGVSRSVVREAVAQLKAEGILVSKQGIGVFVAEKTTQSSFEINAAEFESVHEAIHILELRMAVEVEMCGMAALRRTEQQLANIEACYNKITDKIILKQDSIHEDFNFHKAIAEASGNRYFLRFIEFIGAGVIPAREIITGNKRVESSDYMEVIQQEHELMLRAIKLKDRDFAKAATKAHLENSILRHRQLIGE